MLIKAQGAASARHLQPTAQDAANSPAPAISTVSLSFTPQSGPHPTGTGSTERPVRDITPAGLRAHGGASAVPLPRVACRGEVGDPPAALRPTKPPAPAARGAVVSWGAMATPASSGLLFTSRPFPAGAAYGRPVRRAGPINTTAPHARTPGTTAGGANAGTRRTSFSCSVAPGFCSCLN